MELTKSMNAFSVNGKTYHLPDKAVVVICFDGCGDEYLDVALARDKMPNLKKMALRGYRGMVRGALPSFTNVNNTSIVTGVSPALHGICGNFFYDRERDQEIMMNSAEYLRTPTILAAAAKTGRKVAVITAKDKLRDILSHELEGIAFSAEKATEAREDTHGIAQVNKFIGLDTPPVYSAEASLFVLKAGVALLQQKKADFLYLSLTDYMQHKYAPEAAESLAFYQAIDTEFGRLLDLGAIVGITADHGMNAKQNPDGSPKVIYLGSLLEEKFGQGFRIICPITDPYVKHHGALGSYVVVYLPEGMAEAEVKTWLLQQPGITEVHGRDTSLHLLEQPGDRIGDLIVLSGRDTVLGKTPADHDLSALDSGLRSHGGRYEEMVPMAISHPLNTEYQAKAAGDPRNFDIFEFCLNGIAD
ncbi:phosphonoacetate hydrolase [Catalinimonas niigatensis]|uniref:phosphonoacetate hydrolase n=1 Tax=Catalinimonas niigatensis TaxID=1397264 RepID=UPI0026657A3C|nr:phosphonoacetate hydrolase [Catalinimonas niigatensis]WPP50844.1 phosphonoacetate hydrolase [Catalinimonas niigatensis]